MKVSKNVTHASIAKELSGYAPRYLRLPRLKPKESSDPDIFVNCIDCHRGICTFSAFSLILASKMREVISGMQAEADWRDTGVREEKSVSDSHVGVQTEQELSDSAVQTERELSDSAVQTELELSDSAVQTEQELSDSAVQTTTKQKMVPLPVSDF